MARYGRQGPAGMGGWLAVFVATLVIGALLAAVMVAEHVLAAYRMSGIPPVQHYAIALGTLEATRVAVLVYLAWRLTVRRDLLTPRIVVAGLWLLAIAWPGGAMLARAVTIEAGASISALDSAAFRPVGYAAIWTAYLLRSDRVANTYAAPHDSLADVFG